MKLYVASSWKNAGYPTLIAQLRGAGFDVLDWRNPRPGYHGFHWSEIDPAWQGWTLSKYRDLLEQHPKAEEGFSSDYELMQAADACVLALPCGRSAHLEAGWFIGAGKPTYVYLSEPQEPELMYRLANGICLSVDEVIGVLRRERQEQEEPT